MNEREIFLEALDKPDQQARNRYLDDVCRGDVSLRSKVEELLSYNENAADFLETPPPGLALTICSEAESNSEGIDLHEISLDFLSPSSKPGCLGTLGDYEVVGTVGRGAFGIVLRAYDTKLNRIVAIKVMSPELATNPMAVKRFLREAQAAAAVRHDHVVTIHAIEETNAPPFIVMEFVQGQSLKEIVDQRGTLEVIEILRIGKQMAAGLAAAHEQGLVHRDIKPANILLENGVQRVKITDFGLARAVDDVGMTQTGIIAGTPQYMSPEQGLGQPIDERSDLFSLGSVLYTLCTGRSPFRADSAVATLRRVCDDTPRSIREVNPDIPHWLAQIVMRLLSKTADHRIQSAMEVEQLFSACLAHVQSDSTTKNLTPPAVTRLTGVPIDEHLGSNNQPNRATSFLWVSIGHAAVALFTTVACFIEITTILVLLPILAIGSLPLGFMAFRRKLDWFAVGYVAYWPLVLLILISTVVTSFAEHIMADVILPSLMCFGVLWGLCVVAKQLFDLVRQPTFEFSSLKPNRKLPIGLMYLQCFALALGTANSMIEPEAAVPWAALVLAIGSVALFVGMATSCGSFPFAVSTVIISAFVLGIAFLIPLDDYLFDAKADWKVYAALAIIASVVLVGLIHLHRNLVQSGRATRLTMHFGMKKILMVVATVAAAFAFARPFLQFSGPAFFAGIVLALAVVSLAYLLIVSMGGMKLRRWSTITVFSITSAILIAASYATHRYDIATRQTHLWIDTKQRVNFRVLRSNSSFSMDFVADPGDAGWSFQSGPFEIEIVGRDDLKAVPSKLDPPPRVWTKVKFVPIETSDSDE